MAFLCCPFVLYEFCVGIWLSQSSLLLLEVLKVTPDKAGSLVIEYYVALTNRRGFFLKSRFQILGSDPLQARIQGFSLRRSNFRIILTSKKKGGLGKKTEGCGGSFPSAEVWFKSTFQTIFYIQVYFSVGHGLLYNCKPLSI